MTKVKQTKNINDYFVAFLKRIAKDGEIQLDEALEEWNGKENQSRLVKLVKKTRSSSKKTKDPDRPKRSKSGYLFFCQDKRSTAKANLPSPTAPQVTTELGRMWNELKNRSDAKSKKQMARYSQEAEKDKERYQREMSDYVPPSEEDVIKKTKKVKDPNKPKRSKSSYIFFCSKHRAEIKEELSGSAATDVVRELGKRWRDLKSEVATGDKAAKKEMDQLVLSATQDKLRFAREMVVYNSPNELGEEPVVEEPVVEEELGEETVVEEPVKVVGEYKLFAVAMRSDFKTRFPNSKARQITAKMGKAWRELGDEEKQQWVN